MEPRDSHCQYSECEDRPEDGVYADPPIKCALILQLHPFILLR
jgi:hypothetical protein